MHSHLSYTINVERRYVLGSHVMVAPGALAPGLISTHVVFKPIHVRRQVDAPPFSLPCQPQLFMNMFPLTADGPKDSLRWFHAEAYLCPNYLDCVAEFTTLLVRALCCSELFLIAVYVIDNRDVSANILLYIGYRRELLFRELQTR